MEDYRETELRGVPLRVYPTGIILRLYLKSNQCGKKGEWVRCSTSVSSHGYYNTEIKGKEFKQHRIIAWVYLDLDIENPNIQVDHINQIKTDNRVENLRLVTNQQNSFNTKAKGYYFDKKMNKYRARIQLNGIEKHLGCFDTSEEARERYLQEKAIIHII
jgi:hypothetical protein